MWRYTIRRLFLTIPVMFGVTVLVFSMLHIAPGDPVEMMFRDLETGEQQQVDPEVLERVRGELGLDEPLPVQYGKYIWGAVQGDLGESIHRQTPVAELILEVFPYTLRLTLVALAFAIVVGIFLGVIAAAHPRGWLDTALMSLATLGVSMPNFWLGLLAILVISVHLGALPVSGVGTWQHLVLPAITLGTGSMAILARLTRSSLLETLNEDYVRTARAKGLKEGVIIVRHALRNSLIPVITVIGLQFGALLGGSLIVEAVFARRGLGSLTIEAVIGKDFPLAQGLVLFTAVIYVFFNLLVDLLYGRLDPRIAYS